MRFVNSPREFMWYHKERNLPYNQIVVRAVFETGATEQRSGDSKLTYDRQDFASRSVLDGQDEPVSQLTAT